MSKVCLFKVGDTVIFSHKWGKAGVPGHQGLPNIGERIKISAIKDGHYIQWQGMSSSLGVVFIGLSSHLPKKYFIPIHP